MKKTLLFLSILFIHVGVYAQSKKEKEAIWIKETSEKVESMLSGDMDKTDSGLNFTNIIEMPNCPKNELFVKVMTVIGILYNDGKSVIQNSDKEEGVIFGKGILTADRIKVAFGVNENIEYNHAIKVDIKDNKCRITITVTDFKFTYINSLNNGIIASNTEPVLNQYPFTDYKKFKHKQNSFAHIELLYEKATALLDNIEELLKKQDSDW